MIMVMTMTIIKAMMTPIEMIIMVVVMMMMMMTTTTMMMVVVVVVMMGMLQNVFLV